MSVVVAFVRRDWRITRSRRLPFLFDALSLVVSAVLFYYLGRSVSRDRGNDFFAFAVAGLAVLRLNTAVPRVLAAATGEIASGRLELLVSSRQRTEVVTLGTIAFEVLRGLVLAAAFVVLAVVVFDAPSPGTVAGTAAVATGLLLGAVVFLGLAAALVGVLMVVREAGALASFMSVVLPVVAGAYFPVQSLPAPLGTIAAALPFRRAVDVVRVGLLRGQFALGGASVLAIEGAACLVAGLLIARAGVERARRSNSLAIE